MKKLFIILLLCCFYVNQSWGAFLIRTSGSGEVSPDYIDIDFEGWSTAYDTGTGLPFTDFETADNSPDNWTLDTGSVIDGSNSLQYWATTSSLSSGGYWETGLSGLTGGTYLRFKIRFEDDNDAPDASDRVNLLTMADPPFAVKVNYFRLCWDGSNWSANIYYNHDDGSGYVEGAGACTDGPAFTYDKTYHVEIHHKPETADGNNDGILQFRMKNITDAGSWSSWYGATNRQDFNTITDLDGWTMLVDDSNGMEVGDIEFYIDEIQLHGSAFE